jgi:hypothetical protein
LHHPALGLGNGLVQVQGEFRRVRRGTYSPPGSRPRR